MLEISIFLRRLSDFLFRFLSFLSLNLRLLSPVNKLILTLVLPFSFNRFEISFNSLSDLTSKKTSLIGLLKRSFKDPIFCKLIRLNLFSSLEILFTRVKIKELPYIRISRFNSNIPENINNSKTLVKSVSFITA